MVDLAAVGYSSRRADAVSDRRLVIVPSILGSSAACLWVGGVAALARGGGGGGGAEADGALLTAGGEIGGDQALLHAAFLSGVAAWSLATASMGPALPAYAADLAPEGRRGLSTALFRSCGDVGFVLTPVALGALADATSPPIAMAALAVGAASTGVAFGALGSPPTPPRRL